VIVDFGPTHVKKALIADFPKKGRYIDSTTLLEPIVPLAGRVVVADSDDCVLLIRMEDMSISEPVMWVTQGGACQNDEIYHQPRSGNFVRKPVFIRRVSPLHLASSALMEMG